jgi:hypothetical protein
MPRGLPVLGEWCQDGCVPILDQLLTVAALTLSSIPSSINTYERLAVWAVQCLESISNGDEVNAVAGTGSVPTVQCQTATTADNVKRFVLTAYIPCDTSALNAANAKTWMAAKDVGNAAPHANLLSN